MCRIINFTDLVNRQKDEQNKKQIEGKINEEVSNLESLLSLNVIKESPEKKAKNYWLESQIDSEVDKFPDMLEKIKYLTELYKSDITKLKTNFIDIYPHFSYVAFSLSLLLLDYTGNDVCEFIYDNPPKYTDISYERALKENRKNLVDEVLVDINDTKDRLIDSLCIPHLNKMRTVAALILMTESQLNIIYDCIPNTHKKSQI